MRFFESFKVNWGQINLRLFVDAFFIISDISTFLVFKFILTETSSDWTQKKIREHLIGRSVIQWKLIPVKGVSMIFEFKKSNCSSSFLSGTFFRLCLRKLELLCGGLVLLTKWTNCWVERKVSGPSKVDVLNMNDLSPSPKHECERCDGWKWTD